MLILKTMTDAIATLTYSCSTCGVNHASGYQCATMRKLARAASWRGREVSETSVAATRQIAKGTR